METPQLSTVGKEFKERVGVWGVLGVGKATCLRKATGERTTHDR